MNFDFRNQLLTGSTFGERSLVYDFCSQDSFRIEVGNLITLGKASLSKKSALCIFSYDCFSVRLGNSFFKKSCDREAEEEDEEDEEDLSLNQI